MDEFNKLLRTMTLEFLGTGSHKITPEKLFQTDGAVFLDVRSKEENESISLPLHHQVTSIQIPVDEIPDRVSEIPIDKLVGIFCSSDVRSSIVYCYLRMNGYTNVRIVVGGYASLTEQLKLRSVWQQIKRSQRQ